MFYSLYTREFYLLETKTIYGWTSTGLTSQIIPDKKQDNIRKSDLKNKTYLSV